MAPSTLSQEPSRSAFRHVLAGVAAVAAVHVYFLLFVRVAFVEAPGLDMGPAAREAAVGLGGLAGSLLAVRCFSITKSSLQLATGFGGCALAAGLCPFLASLAATLVCGLAAGLFLGWTSTGLVLALRPAVHLKRLGQCCGIGVGLACAFCSQPLVATASSETQSWLAAGFAAIGLLASFWLRGEMLKPSSSFDYRWQAVAIWITVFLVLMWLDSASAYAIRHSTNLRADTWEGAAALQGNAFVALCTAVLAGLALNRQQQASTVVAALLILGGACLFLNASSRYFPAGQVFQTAAAAACGTAFFFYPARSGRPWQAGLFFAAAGWLGMTGGRDMARTISPVPGAFALAVVPLCLVALLARFYWIRYLRAISEGDPRVN